MKLSKTFGKWAGMFLLVAGGMGIMYYLSSLDNGTGRIKDLLYGLFFVVLGTSLVLKETKN